MQSEWYMMNSNNHRFLTSTFSESTMGKRFKMLYHEYMLCAVARFGGPIAITPNLTKVIAFRAGDPSQSSICIYDNEGQILHQLSLPTQMRNIIVFMDFTLDETLLVVFQKGDQWAIDPHLGTVKKTQLQNLRPSQYVVEGKVFDNGYALLTSLMRFLYIYTYDQPQLLQFCSCEQELKGVQPLHWNVFAPRTVISEKVQLHLTHPTAGIVQVTEAESKRYFLTHEKAGHLIQSKLPHIQGIRYISNLSPNRKSIAYFVAQPQYKDLPVVDAKKKKDSVPLPPPQPYAYVYRVVIAPSINSDTIDASRFKHIELRFVKDGTHINNKEQVQKLQMRWCGNKAVVLQLQNHELYLVSVEGECIKIEKERGEKEKWSFLSEEVDGVRIVTRKDNKVLRQIPPAYIAVFKPFSQEPGALLYTAYEAFEDQAPLQDDQIRKEKEKLAKGVEQCIESSRYELNFDTLTKLMRAAAYGKAFLPPNLISNNVIYETAKALRIVHHIRQKLRYITLDQFQALNDENLLNILLRNREHYLAFEIYSFLKKDQNFRVRIFTDWACCKVANNAETEQQICGEIRGKLQMQSGISFTQIAYKSIELGRSGLAMRLLQFEPSIAKKVPLLLWMGGRQDSEGCLRFYEKAIEQALRSREVNLLYLVFKKILETGKMLRTRMQQMMRDVPQGHNALKNYYRMFDLPALLKYYQNMNDYENVILEELKMAQREKEYATKQRLYQLAAENFKKFQSKLQIQWRKPTFKRLFDHFCQFTQSNPAVQYTTNKVKPETVMRQLEKFMARDNGDAIGDMKEAFNISEKRIILSRIKVLIEGGKWEDLINFVDKYQKKFDLPVELIADQAMKKGDHMWGMKLIARMPDKQRAEQYLLLQRINKYEEAINLAADRKDLRTLQDISSTLLDPKLIALANEKIASVRRR